MADEFTKIVLSAFGHFIGHHQGLPSLESVGQCLRGKQYQNAIHFSKNLLTAYCTAYHSHWKIQNEDFRMFGCQSEDRFIFLIMKTKHSVHIMVFGVVKSKSDVMPPFISPHNLMLSREVYIKCLVEVELPWIEWLVAKRLHLATELGAMPHKQENPILTVRKFLQPHHLWPTNSWDYNLLDYYMRDAVEGGTNKTQRWTRETAAFTNVNKYTVGKACERLWNCLETVVETNGDFFE